MAQLLVRNLETQLKIRLQKRAKRHGQSMEEEARDILRDALKQEDVPGGGLGTEIAALFREIGLEKDIPEIRSHAVTPATFESCSIPTSSRR
jgi:plasmid stability protein